RPRDHPRRVAAGTGPRLPARAPRGGGMSARRARRWAHRLEPMALNVACGAVAVFILAPFAWMLVSSVSGEAGLTRRPPIFAPSPPAPAHYALIFTRQSPTPPARPWRFVPHRSPQ